MTLRESQKKLRPMNREDMAKVVSKDINPFLQNGPMNQFNN